MAAMSDGDMSLEGRKRRGDSTRTVYERLRAMILSLELPPGQKIDEARLAEICGVSRTPVREALFRLSADGLVLLLPNRVTQVAELDSSTLHDYLEGMDLVQRALTRWAAVRSTTAQLDGIKDLARQFDAAADLGDVKQMVLANHAFHAAIGDAAGNALLAQAYRRLLDVGLRVARFTLHPASAPAELAGGFVAETKRQHWAIIGAMERRQPDEAERLALLHTEMTRERFTAFLNSSRARDLSVGAREEAARNDSAALRRV